MDIISHTLTGIAVGTVVAASSKLKLLAKVLVVLVGGFGGALPDLDAISLWSKFDATIGALFGLSHRGKEIYFGKFWYSHHGALHSLVAPLLIISIWLMVYLLKQGQTVLEGVCDFWRRKRYYLISFFFGFIFHLLEDMPTPASVWGGVRFLFPSENYIGGAGKIWWWNNYDLFLIICAVILINLLVNFLPSRLYKLKSKAALTVFLLGLSLFLVQINTRPFDFAYEGHSADYPAMEAQSLALQKEILGEELYSLMVQFDHRIPLYF